MRSRQRLVRCLITEIVADIDEKVGEIGFWHPLGRAGRAL